MPTVPWKRWAGGRTIAPDVMNTRTELHPVELMILAVMLVIDALLLILLPLIALLLTVTRRQPVPQGRTTNAKPSTPEPRPATGRTAPPPQVDRVDPGTQPCRTAAGSRGSTTVRPWLPPVVADLEALPVTTLRRMARAEALPRALTRSGRRAELVPALAGAAMAW